MEENLQADNIRQNIESTRAALDQKLDMLEHKARETLDLKHQIGERPWAALGLAVAAGYVVGTLGGDEEDGRPLASHTAESRGLRSAIDSELTMLKGAAMALLSSYARDALREYMPKLRATLSSTTQNTSSDTHSSATNHEEIPTELETLYGQPPTHTSGGSEYFDVAPSRTGRPT